MPSYKDIEEARMAGEDLMKLLRFEPVSGFKPGAPSFTAGEFAEAAKARIDLLKDWRLPRDNEPSKAFEPIKLYYWGAATKPYMIRAKSGGWVQVNDRDAARFLRQKGVSDPDIDKYLNEAVYERSIDYLGPMAGYEAGVYSIRGKLVLVDSSPTWVKPIEGAWNTVRAVLINMLGEEQFTYFCAWLKISRQSIVERTHIPGQALVIAGPAGCGKSLTQNEIITPLLGGRSGNPFPYLCGRTSFNSELLGYEHLVVSDQTSHTEFRMRREFGERIKDLVANEWHRCEAKYGRPIELDPFWRLSITLNDEPENLQILPPLEDSLEDKLTIFYAEKKDLPMPTRTPVERRDFRDVLRDELPGFAYYLDHAFEVPQSIQDGRFGVRHYHHTRVTMPLQEMAPEDHLLDLIVRAIGEDEEPWEGTPSELIEKLACDDQRKHEVRQLLKTFQACGTYLKRLMKRYPEAIKHARRGDAGARTYTIIGSLLSPGIVTDND